MKFQEMYEEYALERTGSKVLVLDYCFMVYRIDAIDGYGRVIYVDDLFVSSKNRKSTKHSAVKLMRELNKIAKEIGDIKEIRGKVVLSTDNATESLKANLYYGYKAVGAHDDKVFVSLQLDDITSGGAMRGNDNKQKEK